MPRKKKEYEQSPAEASAEASELDGEKAKEMRLAAEKAMRCVFELASDEGIENKLKFEIYKWICEMYFGKPQASSAKSDSGEQNLVLSFEGDLEKWSREHR